MSTLLKDLIQDISEDIPTNIFTIEDKDPMVILGKINEVISKLEDIRGLISDSDIKANEALDNAITALRNSQQALESATLALKSANNSIETANNALFTANASKEESANAISVANGANTKSDTALANSDTAITDSANAIEIANGADSKVNGAVDTANSAVEIANGAVGTANSALESAGTANTNASNALSKSEDAVITANGAEAYAINADANASTALDNANTAVEKAQEALDKVIAGLGTTIYDYSDNALKNAKFSGSDSISVDLADGDPNKFTFKLDQTFIDAINNATDNITTITNNLASVAQRVTTNEEAIETINTTLPNKANVNYVDDSLALKANTQYVNTELAKKVDIVSGKGLSTNDFNNDLLTKLNGVEAGAQKNVIPNKVKDTGNGTEITFYYSSGGSTNPDYYTCWNGYQLTYISKAQAKTALGSVVESGSNYVRFGDGTQICWGSGSASRNGSGTANLAKAFIDTSYRVCVQDTSYFNAGHWQGIQKCVKESTTNIRVYNAYDTTVNYDYIAVGRWK